MTNPIGALSGGYGYRFCPSKSQFVHFKNKFIDLVDSKTRLAAKCSGAVLAWGEAIAPERMDRPIFLYTKNICEAANLGLAPRDLIKTVDKVASSILNPSGLKITTREGAIELSKDFLKGAKALKDTLRGYRKYTRQITPGYVRYLDLFCATGNLVQDLSENTLFRPKAIIEEIRAYEGNKYRKITQVALKVIADGTGTTQDAIVLANLVLFRTFCPHLSLLLGAISLTATVLLHFLEESEKATEEKKGA
ncbi:MAG: hypothetical protein FJZ60_00670 [Chlamydiae bacterium]|nr:hypothetical protein [Chlamydiota bacterium]